MAAWRRQEWNHVRRTTRNETRTPVNPTGQPFGMPPAANPPSGPDAKQMLSTPAILLLVAAGLAIAFGLFSIVSSVATAGSPDWVLRFVNDDALKEQLRQAFQQSQKHSATNYIWPIAIILANAFVIFGALQMRAAKAYPAALSAAIISAIPCMFTSCCCVFSMPAGIWAIVVMMKPEVKAQFT